MTRRLVGMGTLLLLALAIVPMVMAADLQKDLTFTINEPVALPHTMLTPGTYDLRLVDMEHSIAVVTREDGTSVGEYFVTRIERPESKEGVEVVMGKLSDGTPALMEWFYPDQTIGFQLNYEQKPAMLAQQSGETLGK